MTSGAVIFHALNVTNAVADQGAAIRASNAEVTVRYSNLFDCRAELGSGGAMHLVDTDLTMFATDVYNSRSSSEFAGGVYIEGESTAFLRDSSFYNNSSNYGGSAVYADDYGKLLSLVIQQCTFALNTEEVEGTAFSTITMQGTHADSSCAVYNSTIAGNIMLERAGLSVDMSGENAQLTIDDSSILADNVSAAANKDLSVSGSPNVNITNSLIQNLVALPAYRWK